MGVTYFKQLEGFVGGAYAITYSKYVNTEAIHALSLLHILTKWAT